MSTSGLRPLLIALLMVPLLRTESLCAVQKQVGPRENEAGKEVEVITPASDRGLGVGCTQVKLAFSGRAVRRIPGSGKVGLPDAKLTALGPYITASSLRVAVAADGNFEGAVQVWDETWVTWRKGVVKRRERSPGYLLVELSAEGCESKVLRVDRAWRERAVTLKCAQRAR